MISCFRWLDRIYLHACTNPRLAHETLRDFSPVGPIHYLGQLSGSIVDLDYRFRHLRCGGWYLLDEELEKYLLENLKEHTYSPHKLGQN